MSVIGSLPDIMTMNNGSAVTPALWQKRRAELIGVLCEREYGFLPPAPPAVASHVDSVDKFFFAGKATLSRVTLSFDIGQGSFSFPVNSVVPNGVGKFPAFIHLNFSPDVPDKYMPSEEICDNGFAVFSFFHRDIVSDIGGFDGIARLIYPDGTRPDNGCGKIAMWAYAAMRVMDYAVTLPGIDASRVTVIGHSRLGKAALLAGGLDERFFCVVSNDSGCSGAAITRGKTGEHISDICTSFPGWFCENYRSCANNEGLMPFDQHFLLALTAPRLLYVGSASEDSWADPKAEFDACVAASPAFKMLGAKGLHHSSRAPRPGQLLHGGSIAYHMRRGTHFFSREDWAYYMKFIKKNL